MYTFVGQDLHLGRSLNWVIEVPRLRMTNLDPELKLQHKKKDIVIFLFSFTLVQNYLCLTRGLFKLHYSHEDTWRVTNTVDISIVIGGLEKYDEERTEKR